MKQGFDNDLYLKVQSEKIEERIKMFDKLYLEFGGKLLDDYHACRVLPGFEPDSKIKLLEKLKDICEIIFCISAPDIEKNRMRADYGISYELELLRLIDKMKSLGIAVNSVVITLFNGQKSIEHLKNVLKDRNIKVYIHCLTKGYPDDVEVIVSDEGYGKNPYIETTKKLVVVTAPGPYSGKLGTCLSQLYHESKKGINVGYAKFETFPVWNLDLMHPVNVAYEAATVDLGDVNMIDTFHLNAYGESAVNYNRDLSTFPILKNVLHKITGKEIYKSPTDMGVNTIKQCIIDEDVVKQSAEMEIIRRYYNILSDYKRKLCPKETLDRMQLLMNRLNLTIKKREIAQIALAKKEIEDKNVVAIELPNGKKITGKESELLSAASAMFLNAIKEITKIPDEVYLLSPKILEAILKTKQKTSYKTSYCLNIQEVLIALSICSSTNPIIEKAISTIEVLRGCEAHSTYIMEQSEINVFKNLGINLTCEA